MTEWNLHQPTAKQVEMTRRVEHAICNEVNLLAREGVPLACLLSGMGVAIADLLTCQQGSESVAPWFAAQAEMIRSLQAPN